MIQRFKEFLIDNGIYDAYTDKTCDVIEGNPRYYLYGAFPWSETPEGSKYWSDINRKWIEIVSTERRKNK